MIMKLNNYQSKNELYIADRVFDTLSIDLCLTNTEFDDHLNYLLQEIRVDALKHEKEVLIKLQEQLKQLESLGVDKQYSADHASWSVFYAFKEIIDQINEKKPNGYKTVYRGQPGNWELRPTLFRSGEQGYSDEFRRNYEHIYKSIAQRFPESVSYYAIESDLDKRAENLAELQHYGLGTPLVDVSANPFISLLFMVDGYSGGGNEPQLDIFFVRENGGNSLYQEVTKQAQNKRISVQKGAFLNFDKLNLDGLSGEKKIPRVCLRLKFVDNTFDKDSVEDLPDMSNANEGNREEKKGNTLVLAVNDIKEKLNSYYYRSEDLYPDFYMYLGVLKNKYADVGEIKTSKWYQLSND